jgi:hypothetical protein
MSNAWGPFKERLPSGQEGVYYGSYANQKMHGFGRMVAKS